MDDTKDEKKLEQASRKLDRWQIATGVAWIVAALLGGMVLQAVFSPLPVASNAVYDETARNDAADAIKKATTANSAVSILETRVDRLSDTLHEHMRRSGYPSGVPDGAAPIPKRGSQ